MLWQICVGLLVVWKLVSRYKRRRFKRLDEQLKCDMTPLPFIGHAYKFIGNDEDQMNAYRYFGQQAIKYNGLSKMWIGNALFVIIADPDVAEYVLKTYLGKSSILRFIRDVIGNGSIFASVKVWRPRRKILAPTFSPKNLNSFVPIFARQSGIMTDLIKSRAGTGPFSVWDYFTTYTMDSVCESTLGVKVNAQSNQDHPFLKNFETGSELVAARIICPWMHSNAIYSLMPAHKVLTECRRYLNSFIDGIIDSKRKSMKAEKMLVDENKNHKRNDNPSKETNFKTFLEMLIESSGGDKGYSDVELREETLVLVMAGTDTSAVGSSFAAVMLSRHQDVQEKVYQELQEVFGNSTRPVTPEDLPRLKYLNAVLKETMRLYPPVPIIIRQCHTNSTIPSTDINLVRGCVLMINIFAIHRNPRYWGPDAEDFRPERFLEESQSHPAQFIAFSYGPRNCLGYNYAMMSMKTALATLLRRYRILPDSNNKPIRLKFDIMMKDVDKFSIKIEKRRKS